MRISSHSIRTASMPLGMIVGALLCRPIVALDTLCGGMLTPVMICTLLFFTFCRVDMRKMRPTMMHLWLMVAQIACSIIICLLLRPFGDTIAQGGMICALAPVAMAAVVIGGMLGAKVETMATYSLICNVVTAFVAPVMLSQVGSGECSLWQILAKVAPLLVAPFVAGQLCRLLLPNVAAWFASHSRLSFYIWLASLAVIMGRTTAFIIDYGTEHIAEEIALAAVAGVICIVQFSLGRYIGSRYGDVVAGGQSLGQKNTVLAVWMAQSFLNPLSCIAPTAYIVWQNIVNSYQLHKQKDL